MDNSISFQDPGEIKASNIVLETKKIIQTDTTTLWKKSDTNIVEQLINKNSSLTRASRVLAGNKRAIKQKQHKQAFLTADEICDATLTTPKKVSTLPVNIDNSQHSNQKSLDLAKSSSKCKKEAPAKEATIKSSFINFMMTIFLLCMLCATTTVQGAYDISALQGNNNNNSIYFDKLSHIRIVQDNWKLIVYYNMEPYWKGTKLLNAYYKHIDGLCSKLHQRSHCDIITLQLRHRFSELEYYDRMLRSQQFDKRTRTRRGLINGVGYIANSLFGVLDERFSEQYEKDITTVRSNQQHLLSLWKNQTSVIEAENNLLRRVETSMEAQYKIFKAHLNILEKATNDIKDEIEQIEIVNEFMLSSIIANNVLVHLKSIQDTLLDTITNVQQFNIHLLAPEQLRDELSIISGQLSKDISLPIDNIQTDLPNIYKILKVRARMTAQYFIFEITIPLVSRNSFDLYRLYPVPRQVGSSIVSIAPIADYLAMNLQLDTYLPVSEIELQKCTELHETLYLCEWQKPVYHRKTDNSFCVRDQQTGNCKTSKSSCQVSWTVLHKVNKFMFTCCDQCYLRIICGDQITTERLTGVNIVALGSDCVIKDESLTITSHNQHTNKLNVEPDIVLAEIAPVNKIINLTIPLSSLNESNFKESFVAIDKRIEQMKSAGDQLEREDVMSSHDIHQYIAVYAVAALALACAAFIWWRTRRSASASFNERTRSAAYLTRVPPALTAAGDQLAPPVSTATAAPSTGPPLSVSVCEQYNVTSESDQCREQDVKRTTRGTSPTLLKISFNRE